LKALEEVKGTVEEFQKEKETYKRAVEWAKEKDDDVHGNPTDIDKIQALHAALRDQRDADTEVNRLQDDLDKELKKISQSLHDFSDSTNEIILK